MQLSKTALALLLATTVSGCDEETSQEPAGVNQQATASALPTAPVAAPVPSVKPPPKLRDDCPEGSKGVGTHGDPCEASGDSRMMEIKYTGKTTEQGPKFSVTNKSKLPILYGAVTAYFYDKAGKQLEVMSGGKPRPKRGCSGNIFAGAVKPGEKIYLFFSCLKQKDVPEGTAAIEAEIRTVGFTDEEGTKNLFYWQNQDLTPDERPKGGIKSGKRTE